MSDYKHTFDPNVQEGFETKTGTWWRPVVAYPLFVGFGLKKAKCGCGRKFKSHEDFNAHYIYKAVWENESGYIPELLSKRSGK